MLRAHPDAEEPVVISPLRLLGVAYRLRRYRRLLRWDRIAEVDRASAAVERDLRRLVG